MIVLMLNFWIPFGSQKDYRPENMLPKKAGNVLLYLYGRNKNFIITLTKIFTLLITRNKSNQSKVTIKRLLSIKIKITQVCFLIYIKHQYFNIEAIKIPDRLVRTTIIIIWKRLLRQIIKNDYSDNIVFLVLPTIKYNL